MDKNNAEYIWILMARKLSGEATEVELQQLDEILMQTPHASYSKEILHDFWQGSYNPDRQYAENRYKELVQQIKNMGLDEGKFTQGDHYINDGTGFKKSNKKNRLIALCSFAIMAIISGTLFYTNSNNAQKELAEIHTTNQVNTKNGSKTNLVLPDGTKVWLNSSSQLTYDKNYGNKLREVSLSGEAYFDVVKNADKPFVIHTTKMDIKVLGTAFNVKSYPGEKTTETSLIRGSIEVTVKDRQEKIMLKPNEKLVINNEDATAETNPKAYKKAAIQSKAVIEKPIISLSHLTFLPKDSTVIETAWVQNKFIFSSETFDEVALKMERWYSVNIEFADESLKTERLTGNFEKETVVEALNALQLTKRNSFYYTIKSNNITIYKHTITKK